MGGEVSQRPDVLQVALCLAVFGQKIRYFIDSKNSFLTKLFKLKKWHEGRIKRCLASVLAVFVEVRCDTGAITNKATRRWLPVKKTRPGFLAGSVPRRDLETWINCTVVGAHLLSALKNLTLEVCISSVTL